MRGRASPREARERARPVRARQLYSGGGAMGNDDLDDDFAAEFGDKDARLRLNLLKFKLEASLREAAAAAAAAAAKREQEQSAARAGAVSGNAERQQAPAAANRERVQAAAENDRRPPVAADEADCSATGHLSSGEDTLEDEDAAALLAEDEQEEKERAAEEKAAALKKLPPKQAKGPSKSHLVHNYISQFINSGERYREFSEIDGINVPFNKADRHMIHNVCNKFWYVCSASSCWSGRRVCLTSLAGVRPSRLQGLARPPEGMHWRVWQ